MGLLRRLRQWREKSDGTLSGPALETGSVNTGNIGLEGPSGANSKSILASLDDTDDSTSISWNPTGFEMHDLMILSWNFSTEGGGSTHNVRLQVGGVTSGYSYVALSKSGVVQQAESSWLLASAGSEDSGGWIVIRGGFNLNIGAGSVAADDDGDVISHGRNNNLSSFNSLTLTTNNDCTGVAELKGVDLP